MSVDKGVGTGRHTTRGELQTSKALPLRGAVQEQYPLEALVHEEMVEGPQASLRERVTLLVRRIRVDLTHVRDFRPDYRNR